MSFHVEPKALLIITVLLLSLSLAGLTGAAETPASFAKVVVESSIIDLVPTIKHSGATLTVAGPDSYHQTQAIKPGASASISLIDPDRGQLADGQYRYELTFEPIIDDRTREAMARARATDDATALEKLRTEGKIPGRPAIQSGSFMVLAGSFVTQLEAEATAKDILQADDVIIYGGSGCLCVGLDCVNGESFGYDTVRLKENNLRIHFHDTSTTAGYPSNDWRLVANESGSGGANLFAIEDSSAGRLPFKLEAGAPTNSFFLDENGKLGLGTSTPFAHIQSKDGNTPTVRLQQDGTWGYTPQTWDIAGNEANFFIRDVTHSSRLVFRIQPGAPSDSIFIRESGDIGMGTVSPDGSLEIARSTGAATDMLMLTNNGPTRIYMNNTASSSDWRFNSANNGNFRIADGDTDIEMELQPDGDLTITGSLTTSGSTYPDYVFESGYELMSLDELDTFISTNRHLPKIPTADDVDGGRRINMTELQIQMLEKIEELTLYTLEQHSTIKQLQGSLTELRERLATLEAGQDTP